MTETGDANRVESAKTVFERRAKELGFTNVIRLILFGLGSQKHVGIKITRTSRRAICESQW